MGLNVAAKYEKKVDERFKLKELTGNGLNKDYNWVGVDTINVYSINTVDLGNYTKSGSNRFGDLAELQDTTKSYKVENDKAFTFTIDRFYMESQMGAKKAGEALAREIDEVVIPAKDTQRLSVWATTAAANSQTETVTLSASNAMESFYKLQEKLDDEKVPQKNRIAYVTPKMYTMLKLDPAFIKNGDLSQKMLINGQVGEIDGVKIVKCPTSYFPANTNAILVYAPSTISPNKLTTYRILTDVQGIDGAVVEGRVMFDTFVLEAKKKGVAALLEAASA